MKTIIYQSVYDPTPCYMESGDVLTDHHFKCGPTYGHILFSLSPCVVVCSGPVLIKDNIFEGYE